MWRSNCKSSIPMFEVQFEHTTIQIVNFWWHILFSKILIVWLYIYPFVHFTVRFHSRLCWFTSKNWCKSCQTFVRHRPRINGDQFLKQSSLKMQASRGVRGHALQEIFWILTPLSPIYRVCKSFWKIRPISVRRWKPVCPRLFVVATWQEIDLITNTYKKFLFQQ